MAKRKSDSDNGSSASGGPELSDRVQYVPLDQETRRRYLNYAMSVITSRALPDVRDGLKPVQRRILYVMYEELGLTADAKTRKCAKITGDTTGNYHPHGDIAVYEALVRMAQDFTLRSPLIFGQGNFGSIVGLPPAAPRYTEARLTAVAEQLMNELRFRTAPMRPNYDGTREEPVVLPARFPNLLVNGTTGIAVGMATNMPPHNLGEVIAACVHLIENPDAETKDLLKHIKGPDFPLGGRLITDRKELRPIYEEGRGAMKVRGEWRFDKEKQTTLDDRVVIYSIPYNVETGPLLTEIGAVIANKKLPQLLDVSDQSDAKHGMRIVLELKPGSDADAVMAYLFKHTSLEQNFAYNATCLIPDDHGTLVPARLGLVEIIRHFLTFRFATVRKRCEFQLQQLEQRIHILDGFAIIFNDLDRALKIIRNSDGKRDAADKMMAAFALDEPQTMAILELMLYRIAKLEIHSIMGELAEKQKAADRLMKLLASDKKLWNLVQSELQELSDQFSDKRRTTLGSSEEITEFDPATYIVRENTNVVLSKDGWIKRVGRLQSVETTRVREGDKVLDVIPGSTVDAVIFFSSDGVAYTLPISSIPVSAGYGEPISKHFRISDGVSIIGAVTTDPRFTPADLPAEGDQPAGPYLFVATAKGQVARIPLGQFRAVSTKNGRRYSRPIEGDRVVKVQLCGDARSVFLGSRSAKLIHFALDEVPVLSGAGKGVRGIKLDADDEVLGTQLITRDGDTMKVLLTNEKELTFGQMKYGITGRGGKGIRTSHRSGFAEILGQEIQLIDWAAMEANG